MSHQHYAFTIPQQTESRISVKLRNAASARYGGDWSSIPHAHNYTELFYVVGGNGNFRFDSDFYPVHANQLVIVNPNIMHTEISFPDQPLEYIVVGLEGPELRMCEDHDGRFCILDVPESTEILSCMQSILHEMQGKRNDYEVICQAYTEILFVQLMRCESFTIEHANLEPYLTSRCASVRHFIEGHYKEPLNLDQLADIAKMNRYSFAHAFRREYGTSPINYVIDCRIREAKRLLIETDLALSQISGILGFSSASYFSQVFRRVEEISPVEYRNINKFYFGKSDFSLSQDTSDKET